MPFCLCVYLCICVCVYLCVCVYICAYVEAYGRVVRAFAFLPGDTGWNLTMGDFSVLERKSPVSGNSGMKLGRWDYLEAIDGLANPKSYVFVTEGFSVLALLKIDDPGRLCPLSHKPQLSSVQHKCNYNHRWTL